MYIKPYVFTNDEIEKIVDLHYYNYIISAPSAQYKRSVRYASYITILASIALLLCIIALFLNREISFYLILFCLISILIIIILSKPVQKKLIFRNLKKFFLSRYNSEVELKADDSALYIKDKTIEFKNLIACVSYQNIVFCFNDKEPKLILLSENIFQDIKQNILAKNDNIEFRVETQPFNLNAYEQE